MPEYTEEQIKKIKDELTYARNSVDEALELLDMQVVKPPVVEPPPPPPPVGDYKPYLLDTFSEYRTIAELRKRYPSIDNPNLLQLVGGSLRYNQPKGSNITPQLFIGVPDFTAFWLRVRINWMPGYTTIGTNPSSSNAYKMLAWGWAGAIDGRGTIEISNTDQYLLDWAVKTRAGKMIGFVDGVGAKDRATADWNLGRPIEYIVGYKSDKLGATQRWWKDGKEQVTTHGKLTSGTMPKVGTIICGLNFNNTRIQDQWLEYSLVEIVDGSEYPNPFGLGAL